MVDQINRKDIQVILEVNRKAVEIETVVAEQNEEIISQLEKTHEIQDEHTIKLDKIIATNQEVKLDKLLAMSEEISRSLFRFQVLFITGILGIIAQVISMFFFKK
jgi:hypothetical protein